MNIFEFKMPKMGESISEATIINWFKNVGDYVDAEETILEVATDKVDSEVPSPVSGIITEIRFQKDAIVEVGTVLALISASDKSEQAPEGGIPKKEDKIITGSMEFLNIFYLSGPYSVILNNGNMFYLLNILKKTGKIYLTTIG